MAEYVEVMKQAKRMCEARGDTCLGCPVDGGGTCVFMKGPWGLTEEKIAETEKIVMEWAAEHPEPRYPNWIDWLYQMGVYRDEKRNGNVHTCCLTENAYLPIPADIAEKLGIKPIGGMIDENA